NELENTQALLSVPYALYAKTAQDLVEDKEVEARNHSIYWQTGGNSNTRPPIHFIGTRDDEDFVIKTKGKDLLRLREDGQFFVSASVSGDDAAKKNYPLTIKAKNQGIWIEINENRSSSNNFVTFEDPNGIQGRIEGQTVGELFSDPFFIIQQIASISEGVKLGVTLAANIGKSGTDIGAAAASIASIFCSWAAPGWTFAAIAEGTAAIAAGVESVSLAVNVATTTGIKVRDIGVQYSSGSEDYAEYLERFAEEQDMNAGEIVAVIGGKLTRHTQGAQMLKVISHSPAVLGNMPQPQVADLYEKVAFLGQVYVKINGGANAGDYIIPSGKNDGLGVAIAPKDLATQKYGQIVGVAWETVPVRPLQKVKIGVGMNRNELGNKVVELSQRVDHIFKYLEGEGPLHPEKTLRDYMTETPQSTQLKKLWTNEEFDLMVEQRAEQVKAVYKKMQEEMPNRVAYLAQIPGYNEFMANPVEGLKKMRRDPSLSSYWAQMDHVIQQQIKEKNKDN
ncbi:MAG: peptidase G2 autoproteolytic cleavage domain-containing protein, partial [Bacteroidota bacterium]